MATLTKNYIVTVQGEPYTLTPELFKTFCLFANQLVNNYTDDMVELRFRLVFNGTDWIEITRSGDEFSVVASGRGEYEETLTLAEFNTFVSLCRTSKNCKC